MISQASAQSASVSGAPVFTTDALGRVLPSPDEVGPPRADWFVGIFYIMFINYDAPVYDVSKILAENPDAGKCFAIGNRVVIVLDGKAYETVE